MYMPKGWPKKDLEEKDFQLSLTELKKRKLGIDASFSGYIRVFGVNSTEHHDDYYFLIEHGAIIAAEKVEIERKIRTIGGDVIEEMDHRYNQCEITVIKFDLSQLEISKEMNEECALSTKLPFRSDIDREQLLKRINTGRIDADKILHRLKKR